MPRLRDDSFLLRVRSSLQYKSVMLLNDTLLGFAEVLIAKSDVSTASIQVKVFRSTLIQGGRVCTVRDSRGDDKMAACGQLGFLGEAGPRAVTLKPPERLRESLALTG